MTPRFNLFLLVLALCLCIPGWWLLLDGTPVGTATAPAPGIAELRQLADAIPGSHPVVVEWEAPVWRDVPGTLLAAGTGFRTVRAGRPSFRLGGGGSSVLIDAMPGKSGELADENLHVDPASLARAGAASAHADKVVMLDGPVTGGKPHAIAPGVVAIPAVRGQMVYIRLAGGSEVLLVGDASPLDTNWRELRAPARWWHRNGKVERDQSYAALRAIARLHGEAPGLIVVPGRHIDWLRAARTPALKQGFSPA